MKDRAPGSGGSAPAWSRRSFLRRAGAAVLGAPLGALACRGEAPGVAESREGAHAASGGGAALQVTRPVLLPFGEGAVHVLAPPHELPVAYVSMATRRLFVDHDYRDQVYWDLRAHISVSTGVWRIPLVGDPPTMPVMPGDTLREFEELTMRNWDPRTPPAEGDIRILRGSPEPRTLELACAPLSGGGAWLSGGPWELRRALRAGPELCREDFTEIGTATRFADRECAGTGTPVRVLTWAWLERVAGGGG
ncbi:MAG TPA: hypothetical protein VFQ22_02605 [Longimicrobiales bacterium]|nr:hypothetical protein [Longimicrobiales bacterium]